jgi:hypothetical protein
MEYVMVPVPEEHADAVITYMRWNVGKPPPFPLDEEAVTRVLGEFDEPCLQVLGLVANATIQDEEITVAAVALTMDVSERTVVGIASEINNLVPAAGGPPIVLLFRVATYPPPTGGVWATKAFVMSDDVANLIARVRAQETAPS